MTIDINQLKKQSSQLPLDDIIKMVENMITQVGGYQTSSWSNLVVPGLYRGRNHNHLEGNVKEGELNIFKDESEFWNPPAEALTQYGRCNDIGESLLYCSNSWETSILETRPIAGSFISVSIYQLKQNPYNPKDLLGSRVMPIGIQYLSKLDSLKKHFKDVDTSNRESRFYELDNFLDELFHYEVDDENNHIYKLSIAVTRCMMKNILTDSGATLLRHGMMYPSIIRNKQSYNFIFRPLHARTIYKLHQVQTFKVLENTSNKVVLQLMRNGYTVGIKLHPLDYFDMVWMDVSKAEVIDEIIK